MALDRKKFATEMLKEWGLYDKGWRVKYPAATAMMKAGYHKDTLGYTEPFTKTIGIHPDHLKLDTFVDFKDTVLHEIAHALVMETYEMGYLLPPHGSHWKAMAKHVGAYPDAAGLPEA